MGMLQQSAQNLGGEFWQDISGIIISFIMLGAAMFVLFEKISPVYWAYHWFSFLYKTKELYKNYENQTAITLAEYKAQHSELVKQKAYKVNLQKVYKQLQTQKTDPNYNRFSAI